MASASPTDIFVLDFDGVVCDSQTEVNRSGYEAASLFWPAALAGASREGVEAGLRLTRPRLVRGVESMVMARLLHEDPEGAAERILGGWGEAMLAEALGEWGAEAAELEAFFEQHRAQAMASDLGRFSSLNPMYVGIPEALASCPFPFYVASSKSAGRLFKLLNEGLGMGLEPGSPRVFAGLIPPNEEKIAVLRSIMARPAAQAGASLHFVDDRFETLEAMSQQADLVERWNLYHAGWGYCTDDERALAAALPGVRPLTLPQFRELLRWGVVMGVDDGCEPTAEEAAAGIYQPPPGS